MRSMKLVKKIFIVIILGMLVTTNAYAKRSKKPRKAVVAADIGPSDEAVELVKEADASNDMNKILMQSIDLMGVPYKWGGNSPTRGLDCSGFIHYVYQNALGIDLPRTAAEMSTLGKTVDIDDVKPGDLLFFNHSGRGKRITHVGMYLGNGRFIHAPRRGKNIEISDFDDVYYSRLVVVKRFVS